MPKLSSLRRLAWPGSDPYPHLSSHLPIFDSPPPPICDSYCRCKQNAKFIAENYSTAGVALMPERGEGVE